MKLSEELDAGRSPSERTNPATGRCITASLGKLAIVSFEGEPIRVATDVRIY